MDVVVVTGAAGLIGGQAVRFFSERGFKVVGIDNDMRKAFFGEEASTEWQRRRLEDEVVGYRHYAIDIRDETAVAAVFAEYSSDIRLVIHAAAQPSHDWAANDPFTDFTVNANGTSVMLETTRRFASEACFIFCSTNKVYGDTPNRLPLVERETRWELDPAHPFAEHGIDETMSIDQTKHSLFGASKVAADVLVQEYGRYFGLKTGVFRGGCLTGPAHSGTMLHGFLSYLMRCAVEGRTYNIFGYQGKQVRDNIHACDLIDMFWHFFREPRPGEVYNAGGGRRNSCSVLEAVRLCEEISGRKLAFTYTETNRIGDHIWWISDVGKFMSHYPEWDYQYGLRETLCEIYAGLVQRTPASLRRAA